MISIRVLDFETTGMEPPAEVIEVGYCDLIQMADGWVVDNPVSYLCGVKAIPPEVRAIHHITMAEVEGLEPFSASGLMNEEGTASASAIAAHNSAFEALFLGEITLPLICTMKATLRVWPEAPSHSNQGLRYWLEDQGLVALDNAMAMPPHRAGPDAYVTAHILKALFAAGATGKDMVKWTREPRLLPRCPIGKFRNKPWAEVETGFLQWVSRQPDMDSDILWNTSRELANRGL